MRLTIMTDGGSRGNPGPAAAGVVVLDKTGREVFAGGFFLGLATSNVAEYTAFLRGLGISERLGANDLLVLCDSDLLAKQINGQYKVRNATLKKLHAEALKRMASFNEVEVRHVYRNENIRADALVNDALDMEADTGDAVGNLEALAGKTGRDGLLDKAALPTMGAVSAKDDLQGRIRFDNSGPQRILLTRTGGLFSGLICLQSGQSYRVKGEWRQASMLIMRGSGTIVDQQERHALGRETWLQLNGESDVELVADAGEQLVVILTAQE